MSPDVNEPRNFRCDGRRGFQAQFRYLRQLTGTPYATVAPLFSRTYSSPSERWTFRFRCDQAIPNCRCKGSPSLQATAHYRRQAIGVHYGHNDAAPLVDTRNQRPETDYGFRAMTNSAATLHLGADIVRHDNGGIVNPISQSDRNPSMQAVPLLSGNDRQPQTRYPNRTPRRRRQYLGDAVRCSRPVLALRLLASLATNYQCQDIVDPHRQQTAADHQPMQDTPQRPLRSVGRTIAP